MDPSGNPYSCSHPHTGTVVVAELPAKAAVQSQKQPLPVAPANPKPAPRDGDRHRVVYVISKGAPDQIGAIGQARPLRNVIVHSQSVQPPSARSTAVSLRPERKASQVILPKALSPDAIRSAEDTLQMIRSSVRQPGDLETDIRVNSRYFDNELILSHTRLQTLECRIPAVRCPASEETVQGVVEPSATGTPTTIYQRQFMPDLGSLLSWRCRLEEQARRASGEAGCVRTDDGLAYGLAEVERASALHRAAATRRAVERELEWFAQAHPWPRTVGARPGPAALRQFQRLVLCRRWDRILEDYALPGGELARVCCQRWLSPPLMAWVAGRLNRAQTQTLCVDSNSVESLCDGRPLSMPDNRPRPTSLLLICWVGESDLNRVFLGSASRPGYRYTLCHLDTLAKRITYADSLGWRVPELLPKCLAACHAAVYGSGDLSHYQWVCCHEPSPNSNSSNNAAPHSCTARCAAQYPLQTCLSICGPLVAIVAALACLRPGAFHWLTLAGQQTDPRLSYLQTPTKYACYLRKVLAAWLAEKEIRLEYILPPDVSNSLQPIPDCPWSAEGESLASDPEDDTPEISISVPHSKTSPEQIKLQIETADGRKIFKCPCCQKTSKKGYNIKRHVLRAHPEQDLKDLEAGNCLCLHCSRRFRRVCDLRQHLQVCHATILTTEKVSFGSMAEFETWKTSLEEAESCFFAQYSGFRNKGEYKFRYLQCNRSGMYRQTGMGRRQTKHSGTCKIDNNCTASIKVTCQPDGTVEAVCHRTHYGHSKDRERMWLPRRRRDEVAAKLGQGVSRERILEEAAAPEAGPSSRLRGAAGDVRRPLAPETVQRHPDEKDSVLAWIRLWETAEEESPVLFCKLPGLGAHPSLDLAADDYLVVLQSPFQRHMAQKLAGRGVWWDSTQESGAYYDFHLMTLLALNEFGEAFPMAWCLSNRGDEGAVKIFFGKVREACGDLSPAWFMADASFTYANLWGTVFRPAPLRLICPWHVDRAWKEELKNEISDLAVQAQVYKMLRAVLEQHDETAFQDALQRLLGRLAVSDKTLAFRRHFVQAWVPKMHQWAYCYQARHGLNPGIFAEAFHVRFRRAYPGGGVEKRVDSCLVHLLRWVLDRTYGWMERFPRVKATVRLRLIHDRHLRSMVLSFSQVKRIPNSPCWRVQTEDKLDSHTVERLSAVCPAKECRLRCQECSACVHLFLCSCPDCLINSTLCKHIHLVQRLLRLQALIQSEEAGAGSCGAGGGETEDLKRRLCSSLRQMTSMVEVADHSNLETLRELSRTLATSSQLLNLSIQQASAPTGSSQKRPIEEKAQDPHSKKTKT